MGKTIIITGANSGIGKITAIELAKKGNNLILIMRDSSTSKDAYTEISAYNWEVNIDYIPTDLSSFESIKRTIVLIKEKYQSIDVILNNAGVYKSKRELSKDGIEVTFMVNYLAPYYFTTQLIELLSNSENPRIVNVSSALHKNGYFDYKNYNSENKNAINKAYANSKLYLLMFSLYLAELNPNISVFCNHPGVIATNIFRDTPEIVKTIFSWVLTSPEKGAESNIYLSTSDELNNKTGLYYNKLKIGKMNPIASKKELQKELWEWTNDLISKHL